MPNARASDANQVVTASRAGIPRTRSSSSSKPARKKRNASPNCDSRSASGVTCTRCSAGGPTMIPSRISTTTTGGLGRGTRSARTGAAAASPVMATSAARSMATAARVSHHHQPGTVAFTIEGEVPSRPEMAQFGAWHRAGARHRSARRGLDLLDLVELELDGDLALEDRDQHLQLALVLVDLGDLAVEVRQVAGRDLDAVTHRELGLGLRLLLGLGDGRVQHAVDLGLAQRHGLVLGADEAGHAGGVLHERPGVVGEIHVDEHVARPQPPLGLHLLPVLRLDDGLGRDHDAADGELLAHRLDPVLEIGLHLVLVPGIGVDHVPAKHLASYFCRSISLEARWANAW